MEGNVDAQIYVAMVLGLVIFGILAKWRKDLSVGPVLAALLPLVVVLLLHQRISSIGFGDVAIDTAIRESSRQTIAGDMVHIPTISILDCVSFAVADSGTLVNSWRGIKWDMPGPRRSRVFLKTQMGASSCTAELLQRFYSWATQASQPASIVVTDERGVVLGILLHADGQSFDSLAECLGSGNLGWFRGNGAFLERRMLVGVDESRAEVLQKFRDLQMDQFYVIEGGTELKGLVTKDRIKENLLIDLAIRFG